VTSKPDFKVMVLLLVFMQLTRDLFAIAKFLLLLVDVPNILYNSNRKVKLRLSLHCSLTLCETRVQWLLSPIHSLEPAVSIHTAITVLLFTAMPNYTA